MKTILAIETATEACSLALARGDAVEQRHEITPRQHSQRLLVMLDDLLPGGGLRRHGIDAIAYGVGPGSFTGLRIAASAVQGLAYSAALPAIPVSTLAAQAQTALRLGLADPGGVVFSAIDARINEIYYAWFRFEEGIAVPLTPSRACSPTQVTLPDAVVAAVGIGSGCRFLAQLPSNVRQVVDDVAPDLLPEARDLVPLARQGAARGETQLARDVQPVYVRDEINWKKIPEQGKRK